jgi:hypothetical protein
MGWSWKNGRIGSLMFSCPLRLRRDYLTEVLEEKKTVEELKAEWKRLWRERFDDHVRAEGIAREEYSQVFVERGTVILATRNFKLMSFREVLEKHGIIDVHRYVSDPRVGGWGKFIRATFPTQKASNHIKRAASYVPEPNEKQHLKKGGRGWVHL